MQEPAATTQPKKDRLLSLDIIRGIALFGILLINITEFGLPFAYENPAAYGGAEGNDLVAWMITSLFFEGTQRGLFSILFGAGVILLTSRLEASNNPDDRDIYFRRNLWLILFGMVHAYILLWPGDILFSYGVTALFVYSFRHLGAKKLLIVATVALLFSTTLNLFDAYQNNRSYQKYQVAKLIQDDKFELTKKQQSHLDSWRELARDYKPEQSRIQKEIDHFQDNYLKLAKHLASRTAHNESWFSYRFFADWFSMMLFGMALFKLGVLTLQRSTGFYLKMMLGGYLLGIPVNYYEITSIIAGDFSAAAFVKSYSTYDIGRLAMTCGHLGLLLLFVRSGSFQLATVGICRCRSNGFDELYSTFRNLRDYILWHRIWPVRKIGSP